MKTTFYKMIFIAGLVIIQITNCKSPDQKIEEAKEDVAKANLKLEQARKDSVEYVRYREERVARLEEYGQKIENLKEDIKSVGEDVRDSYEKNLNVLKAKNAELKKKIEEYNEQAEKTWDVFKYQLNKEMDELGKSISEMAHKNIQKDKDKKH